MFAICLDFPYQHQIKKIYKDVIYKVSTRIEILAKENACIHFCENEARFYFFDDEKIASTFFVVRFLYLLSFTLDQVSSKIHEYRIIIDLFANEQRYENAIESLLSLKDVTFLYNKVCVGKRACHLFKKYLSYSSVKVSGVSVVDKFLLFEKMNEHRDIMSTSNVPIFVRGGQSYIMALSNFLVMTPFSESELQKFSQAERKTYNETRSVLKFFSKNRFKERIEKYFVDAFIIHAQLHAKMYKRSQDLNVIDIYVDKENKTLEAEKVRQIIGEAKISNSKEQNVNIDSLADDLLELMYILLYSLRFIFVDEVYNFFFEVTGSTSYDCVLSIMYQAGILSKEGMIHSYKEQVLKQFEKKLKLKKVKLNIYIAQFLLNKYKKSELCADIHLKSILDALKCDYDKTLEKNLIVDIFFNTRGGYLPMPRAKNSNDAIFQNMEIFKKYEDANVFQNNGDVDGAISLSKELNTYFHKNRLLSGEYKSFALLSFLYLKKNNITEAQTYSIYALELAKKTKNDSFICEAKYFLSLLYFLQKDFGNALGMLQDLLYSVSTSFMQEWKVFSLFLQARLYLELGQANRAASLFNLAKDFASRYFPNLLPACNIWYCKACIYDGKGDKVIEILKKEKGEEACLFLLEAVILFPELASVVGEVENLKHKYDEMTNLKLNAEGNSEDEKTEYHAFEYMEDIAWQSLYKTSYVSRLFNCFYSYYKVNYSPYESEKIEHLDFLKEMAMESLYAKDLNASILLYFCYAGECAIDGKTTGVALGFLSKACSVLQRACTPMFGTDMRDAFMKENVWNAKLFRSASENKLL